MPCDDESRSWERFQYWNSSTHRLQCYMKRLCYDLGRLNAVRIGISIICSHDGQLVAVTEVPSPVSSRSTEMRLHTGVMNLWEPSYVSALKFVHWDHDTQPLSEERLRIWLALLTPSALQRNISSHLMNGLCICPFGFYWSAVLRVYHCPFCLRNLTAFPY
jgi:hypothetical protein